MPKYQGVCPTNNEVDVYKGCAYRCAYCIAKSNHGEIRPVDLHGLLIDHSLPSRISLNPWDTCFREGSWQEHLALGVSMTINTSHDVRNGISLGHSAGCLVNLTCATFFKNNAGLHCLKGMPPM